jgi:hypothetical protein
VYSRIKTYSVCGTEVYSRIKTYSVCGTEVCTVVLKRTVFVELRCVQSY